MRALDLSEPIRLLQLLEQLRVPRAEVAIAAVNGTAVAIEDARVSDGDRVELFPPVGGGSERPNRARIRYGAEPQQFGDLRVPNRAGPHPVVAVVHGGFWRNRYDLEHIGPLCAALTGNGIATWSVEYRRLGDPGGGWPGTFLDVAAAVNHLRTLAPQYNLDLERVVTMGHSAGGHLALWVAGLGRVARDSAIYVSDPLPLRAAISLAGVIDLRRASESRLSSGVTHELMGGSPAEFPERYAAASPMELLPFGVRQFLLHGTQDDNVPFEISQRYYGAARAKGDDVELIELPGIGHFELIDPESDVRPRLLDAVRSATESHRSTQN
ncbi:MAG: alpha/beta fold hydrolase [Chloroflexi bacterium]|nr:alpha/beta fold hydrolase [Chloroflexota bacterium]